MRKLNRRESIGAIAAGFAATLSQSSQSAEPSLGAPTESSWASFRNGAAQRGLAKTKLATDPQVKWEIKSKDGWVATCAIVGDHVYAPALEGYLYCFDRETGKELWKYRSIESKDPKEFAAGFKAAPLVNATTVFVGDEDGILHAVDRTTGSGVWKYATGAEIAGGVTVYNDKLLLASHDAFLYSLTNDGKEAWKFETNDRINCSPAVVEGFTFVSGCDSLLRVIDLKTQEEARSVEMNSPLIASPAIVEDLLYVGNHDGVVYAVNWKSGEIEWEYSGKRQLSYYASAAVTDDLVLLGSHDKMMHAIDRKSGEARWTFPTRARIESSAAVVDDRVFFGSGDGNIYGVNMDGSEAWKFNAGKGISAGIAIGEGCLVVGEDDANGRLRCFG